LKNITVCCFLVVVMAASVAYGANDIKGMIEEGKANYKNKQFNKALSTFLQAADTTGRDRNMAVSDPDKYEERRYFNAVAFYWAGLSSNELSIRAKKPEEKDRRYYDALKMFKISCEAGYDKACSKQGQLTSGNINDAISALRRMPPPRRD